MALVLKKKLPTIPQDNTNSFQTLNFEELHRFQREWASADNYPLQYGVIRTWWTKATGKKEIPDQHLELLQIYVGYELQAKSFFEAGVKCPANVVQNLEAVREFNINKLTPSMKKMLEIMTKTTPNKGEGMAKAINKKEVKSVGVSQFYLEIFQVQDKAQLSDEEIMLAIEKKCGTKPSKKNVASYRFMYNNGKIVGQKTVPTVKAKAFRPKAEKIKKPMTAETKAKLKAYSDKKKKIATAK